MEQDCLVLPTASEVDLEVCRQAHLLREGGKSWRKIEIEVGLRTTGREAKQAAERWIRTAFPEMIPNRPIPKKKFNDDVLDIGACHQAYLLKKAGEPWYRIVLATRGINSRKAVQRAEKKWIKTCHDQGLCENCGTKKHHLNPNPLCNTCHAEDRRGLSEGEFERAEHDALDGLNRFLSSIGQKNIA